MNGQPSLNSNKSSTKNYKRKKSLILNLKNSTTTSSKDRDTKSYNLNWPKTKPSS